MCVNSSKVALESAAAGIKPMISSRNSNVLTSNHYATEPHSNNKAQLNATKNSHP